jgi:hypothetical protein
MGYVESLDLERMGVQVILSVQFREETEPDAAQEYRCESRTPRLLCGRCRLCAITVHTPWSCNSQWLDLVAHSGTVLLVWPPTDCDGY